MYYLLVAKIAGNDIWIAVMMSGAWYITESITSSVIIASLFGIYLSLVVYKINLVKSIGGGGIFGAIGSGIGVFGIGCPTCGAILFGFIGAPLALMYLPYRGAELRVLSILILLISIYFLGKSIEGKCEVRKERF